MSIYVVACVILLGILIFVHELGHFLVARWCGVRVEVFSLGFGRKIWKKTVGDTTYCVSMIPLGGYVKMFGEQPGAEIPAAERAHSFTHKTVWQRIAIVLAGPLMNLFFAAVIFAVVAMVGQERRSPVLGDVDAASIAGQAGFRSGDRVLAVDGQETTTFDDVSDIMDERIGRTLSFKVAHADGRESEINAAVASEHNPNPLSLRSTVGHIEGFSTASRASIVGVPRNSPLWALGLRTGDRIMQVGARSVSRYRELPAAFQNDGAAPVEIKVERYEEGRKPEQLSFTLPAEIAKGGFQALRLESPELYLARVVAQSPAQEAGLKPGDRLTSVDGKPVSQWSDVLKNVGAFSPEKNETMTVEFVRDGEARSVQLKPQMTSQVNAYGGEDRRFTIGIMTWMVGAPPDVITVRTLNPVKALVAGAQQSWEFSVITVLSFVRLFNGDISHKTVGGLLSIGQAAGETMKLGIGKFLTMMAIISVNLFVLNLLPVPVLDGGHLVFYTIEVIKGSPLSLKKIEIAQQVGLLLLMGLMVFALFNDVTRIFFQRL
ncbi:MAG: RIP metalloprotease RseP [Bdellovibrionaceae bacterium]|nr:RIP metalloprotease RseP [Pseudobdellovibrionaceae bacterium]MBX3033735.1 RIP metalloprotease RseP [Pseudobdellovibrionaceae bacterium]